MRRQDGRWWRPAPRRNVRPAVRARRRTYTADEVGRCFDVGYECGQADERKRHEQRDEMLHRLAEACEEGPEAVSALAAWMGVTDDAEQLVDEVERFLGEQD